MHFKSTKLVVWTSAFATAAGVGYLIKDNSRRTTYHGEEKLTDKVVIVTGANTGIGREVARQMALRDAKVIMACRDLKKCEKARRGIVLESHNKYVYCRKCDLASQKSIREFVARFEKEHSQLNILINNGGVMRCPKSYTQEGIELQLGVNHMGHFLLTNLLLNHLKKSTPSRIINLTSAAHYRGKINVKDLNSSENYDPKEAYNQSKLANVLFTKELADRLKGTGVTVNAVYPGIVNTEINRHMTYYNNFLARIFVRPILWMFVKSSKRGAQPVIKAAIDPELENSSGTYFSIMNDEEPSEEARNEKLARWLWLTSEKWTSLHEM